MDIFCPSCGEPWSYHHMRRDEPFEWGLSEWRIGDLLKSGRFVSESDPVLEAAENCGWRFATLSVLSFTRCPACEDEPVQGILAAAVQARQERALAVKILSEVLDGDEDALASELAGL